MDTIPSINDAERSSTDETPILTDYGLSTEIITFATLDGNLFRVDKSVLSTASTVFRHMFEDATDDETIVQLKDSMAAWKLVLDILYEADAVKEGGEVQVIDCAILLCDKYEMKLVRSHLILLLW